MIPLMLWLRTGMGQGAMIGLAVTMAFGWLKLRDHRYFEKGAESVRVETKKANDATVQTSARVRAKSQSSSMRGTRDPYTAD